MHQVPSLKVVGSNPSRPTNGEAIVGKLFERDQYESDASHRLHTIMLLVAFGVLGWALAHIAKLFF